MSSYHSKEETLAQLPQPSADAVAHSSRLVEFVVDKINQQNGVIAFSDYMQHLLYAPGLGYYSAGLSKFGAQGDFVTAPEISPLFGRTLAKQCRQLFDQGCVPKILEFGAGSGKLCLHILETFDDPIDYLILELSADLRDRQQTLLRDKLGSEQFDRITWLDQLPQGFSGVVIGNELLDAMPVSLVKKTDQWVEMGINFDGEKFGWQTYSNDSPAVQAIQQLDSVLGPLPEGYLTEVNLNYGPWLQSLAQASDELVVLLIDYGYEQHDYYYPQRSKGTLICHYQHRAHDDVLVLPGLQDITASVDFDAVADAAIAAGFELVGLCSQAQFLLGNGLLNTAAAINAESTVAQIDLALQIKTLTLPGEMGERFKVIALQKNLELALPAFHSGR